MYLSRSQIINRDAVVWIEREGGNVGESMGKWGGARGNGRKETEKVANGSDRRAVGWRVILQTRVGGKHISVMLTF